MSKYLFRSPQLRLALLAVCLALLGFMMPGQAKAAVTILFADDFADNSAGWTLGPEWEIGPATASSGETYGNPDPDTDHTPTADNGIAGVVIGGNPARVRHLYYYLTSPVIDADVLDNVTFEYYRWLNSDFTPYMQNTIDVFDGATWVTIWSSGGEPGIQDDAWTHQVFDITAYKNASLQVRFGFQIGSSDVFTVSSWNIDDVRITSGENEAPIVNDQTFAIAENSPNGSSVGTVVASDPDAGDTLTFAIVGGNSSGAFAVHATTGQITVADSSQLDFETTPTFDLSVQVTDSGNLTDTATITINLINVNEFPPTVNNQSFSIAENSPNGSPVGTVVASDADGNDSLTFAITGGNSGGAFAINAIDGQITVADSSQLDFETTPTFNLTVQVTDSGGLFDTATATIHLTNVNEAPTVNDQSFAIAENSPNGSPVGTVVATDPDAGSTLSFAITSGNTGGAFAIHATSGQMTVANSSQLDFETTPTFFITVRVTDGGGLFDAATITVNLTNINEAPTVNDQSFTIAENSPNGSDVGTVIASDPDAGDTLSFAIISGNTGGAFALNTTTGQITVADSNLLDYETTPVFSLTVEVADDSALLDTAVITIHLTGVNEFPPTVNDHTFTIAENSPNNSAVGDIVANDPDADDPLSFAITNGNTGGAFAIHPSNGTLTVANSSQLDFESTPTFTLTVRVTDSGGLFDSAMVTINLTDVNDAPIANDDTGATDEDSVLTVATDGVLANDGDPDAGDVVGVTSFDPVSTHGASVNVNSDGSYSYDPTSAAALQAVAAGSNLTDSFTYTISDNSGLTASATVLITVSGVNDAPAATDDATSTPEDVPATVFVLINDVDIDGDALTVSDVGTPANGTAVTNGSSILYTPALDFIGTDVFTYTIDDGNGGSDSALVTINVGAVNDPPAATDDTGATDEDTVLTVPAPGVLGNDSDPDVGDPLAVISFEAVSAQGANIHMAADGSYIYDPRISAVLQTLGAGQSLVDSFSYTVSDNGGLVDTAVVHITVTGLNDPPVAVDDSSTTLANTPVVIPVLANDSDVEGDTLNVTTFAQGMNGLVTDNGDGILTYAPDIDFIGTDVFTYTVADGNGGSSTALVSVVVTADSFQIFLPVVVNNPLAAPDLIVSSIQASSDQIEVVIHNQGNAPTVDAFWVDFYIAPSSAPSQANQLWQDLSSEGIAWGVTVSLNPGESLTLIYSTAPGAPNLYYQPDYSLYSGTLAAGTPVYAQVDSAHMNTTYGGVLEDHEITGGAYNNVSDPVLAES